MTLLYVGETPGPFQKCATNIGASIIIAQNSVAAITQFKLNQTVDVIICEHQIAKNNAFLLFDKIKALSGVAQIPFILLSEVFDKEILKTAFKKGVSDYFVSSSTPADHVMAKALSLIKYKVRNVTKNCTDAAYTSYKIPLSKRVFDIIFASLLLLLTAPFLLIIMLAIRLESKGKVYYIARRVGRSAFNFYKLRSMRMGSDVLLNVLAKEKNQYNKGQVRSSVNFKLPCPKCSQLNNDESCSPDLHIGEDTICDYWYQYQKNEINDSCSAFIKITDDPRVTKVGKIIRNTSIDELPQLINVLKGDMSIVGNRPLPLYEAELLTKDKLSKRFLAPAGITGLWQVELRGRGGEMSEEERIEMDNKYANNFVGDNYCFWYDIKIILRTIPALLQKSTV
jgi:lipopolysaccharide/colanic/teichoic acid biosynthesis glycosyltransferase